MNFLKNCLDFITGKDKADRSQQRGERAHSESDAGPRKQQRYSHHRRQPLLTDSPDQGGGVQGFGWYFDALKRDADGDEAHEFVTEESGEKDEGDETENASP